MTTHTTTATESPTLSAQDLGKRVLSLIEHAHGLRDLAPDNVEKRTGLPIEAEAGNPDAYGVTGKLTDTWYYGLRSMTTGADKKPNRLLFEFSDQTDADADMTPVCIDFEPYQQALTAAGFSSTRLRNRVDTQDYWEFTRGDIGVTVYLRGKRTPDDAQTCVSMLIVNAYD